MNRWLMKTIVELAAYLRLEAPIPLDMSGDYADILEGNLQHLTKEERKEFTEFIEELARVERDTGGKDKGYLDFLESLPEEVGLVEPKQQLYYVSHLTSHGSSRLRRDDIGLKADQEFEIQVLDVHLRGRSVGYISLADTELTVEDHVVPVPVLEAAKKLAGGHSDYVNKAGDSVDPMWGVRSLLKKEQGP